MAKILKFSIFVFGIGVVSLVFATQVQAAQVQFTEDTQLDLVGLDTALYVKANSECDSLTVSNTTLNTDIPAGSTFTLKTANYTVLSLSPSGGTVTLAFDTSYFGTGYVSQWTASSSVEAATVSFTLSVPVADAYYLIKVNGVNLSYFKSSSGKLISFSYTGGFSNRTFTITRKNPAAVPTDVTPPTISQISVVVSQTTTTISWKTDESSLSWIVYGTTTDYGLEQKTTTYVTFHSLTLTDLSASTTYHYQIKSQDSAGNIGSYTDQTFTTLAEVVVEIPIVKPIAEMTIAELQAEISRITALIAQLQAQLAELIGVVIKGVPAEFSFETNLKYDQVSTDVKYLQIVLNSDPETRLAETGVGSPGRETNYFGPLTKAAVIKFQEKYASEVLAPWEFTKGTGFVGKTTRAKLNAILGRQERETLTLTPEVKCLINLGC